MGLTLQTANNSWTDYKGIYLFKHYYNKQEIINRMM